MAVYLGNRLVSGAAIGLGSTNSIIRPLPEEYQEVEWIGTNNDAYLTTDFIPRVGDEIITELLYNQTDNYPLFASEGNGYMLVLMPAFFKYFTTGDASYISQQITHRWLEYRIDGNGRVMIINREFGGSYVFDSELSKVKVETNAPLYIFHRYSNNTVSQSKMKYIRFKRRGEYVFNAIPCYRKSDNVIGMYDVVSDTFYTNQGTGTFSKGIDIIAEKYNKPIVSQKFKAYYIVYDNELADYRFDYIQDIEPGDVITLKTGKHVEAAHVGTEDENPDLLFQEWSCPLEQINGTITIPSRVDCDLYIGAVYVTADGLNHDIYNAYGDVVRIYYGNTTTALPYAAYAKNYKVLVLSKNTNCNQKMLLYNRLMTALIIPQSCTTLDNLFSTGGMTNIKALVLPHGLTTIKGISLGKLIAMHHFWMPDTINTIDSGILQYSAVKYLHISDSLSGVVPQHFLWDAQVDMPRLVFNGQFTALRDYSIRGMNINAVYFSSRFTSIPGYSFNGTNPRVIVCNATTPPEKAAGDMVNTHVRRVYVPSGCVSAYEAAEGWSVYVGKFYEYTRANCEAHGDEYIELQ